MGRKKAEQVSRAGDGAEQNLKMLGERVRNARARRGMTRKMLARDSGVSERYLAQLEGGQGNISITLLRQVAAAMDLPVTELVREGPDRPVEATLMNQLLERLNQEELVKAHRLLAEHFGEAADGHRASRVALIGLRGAGKTELGRRLADYLKVPFVYMGEEIERESGMSASELFELSGQAAYRRYERRCLERVLGEHSRAVIETGGSLVSEAGTFGLLLNACFTVWIQASAEEHMARVMAQGDMRPLADTDEAMDDLRRILEGREPFYEQADATVDTSGKTVDDSFADLLESLPAAVQLRVADGA